MLWKIGFYEANLVDKIRIQYFLEDRAQEGFIKSLVERIVEEESIPTGNLIHGIRSAHGGLMITNEFKKFLTPFSYIIARHPGPKL